jgi:hypothetical protein
MRDAKFARPFYLTTAAITTRAGSMRGKKEAEFVSGGGSARMRVPAAPPGTRNEGLRYERGRRRWGMGQLKATAANANAGDSRRPVTRSRSALSCQLIAYRRRTYICTTHGI